MTNLLRKAWDLAMKAKGLRCQEMADGTNAWWFPTGLVHNDKLPVRKDGRRLSYRNVGGTRTKRSGSLYWHLGFSVRPKLGDAPHFVLKPRVMISEDQAAPIADRKRMNRLRKGICKLWFNPIWRDQTLGFVQWLADGNAGFHLPLADNAHCITADGPKTFVSPVSIAADDTASDEADEDREAAEKLAALLNSEWVMPRSG